MQEARGACTSGGAVRLSDQEEGTFGGDVADGRIGRRKSGWNEGKAGTQVIGALMR